MSGSRGGLGALLLVLGGCIPRMAAPDGPAPSPEPYSALAQMMEIEVPPAPTGVLVQRLPERATRLAFGPEPGRVFADDVLRGGHRVLYGAQGATPDWRPLAEGVVVVLVDRRRDVSCAVLAEVPHALAAVADQDGLREAGDGSRDRLGGVPLRALCPGQAQE